MKQRKIAVCVMILASLLLPVAGCGKKPGTDDELSNMSFIEENSSVTEEEEEQEKTEPQAGGTYDTGTPGRFMGPENYEPPVAREEALQDYTLQTEDGTASGTVPMLSDAYPVYNSSYETGSVMQSCTYMTLSAEITEGDIDINDRLSQEVYGYVMQYRDEQVPYVTMGETSFGENACAQVIYTAYNATSVQQNKTVVIISKCDGAWILQTVYIPGGFYGDEFMYKESLVEDIYKKYGLEYIQYHTDATPEEMDDAVWGGGEEAGGEEAGGEEAGGEEEQ